eukprot:CAMPEP_0196160968 /NCGR_PEP_ID=MMETSP0910-20130528/47095_1 /TAXON_ID=49265 /ORGANISM="Thalassiosira rotula, Strain GSO102" /LENGTH=597 /DNA_ID=CAMNT_0041425909 /DNA_START=145 /DNA_END=1939 /DNA_ORIENTATION=-
MTAALVPSAQLRMRGTYSTPNGPHGVASSPYSPHSPPWENGKRQQRRIEISSSTPTPHSSPSLPNSLRPSTISNIVNYYPWRQRHPSTRPNRSATFLHSHSKEKSSYAEDALDFSHVEEIVDVEVDSSLRKMEQGSNSTNGKACTATNDINSESLPNSPELWGIPIQSVILLNLVAVIWGTQHSVIKSVVDDSTISLGAGFFKWMEHMGINLSMLQTDVSNNGGGAGGDGAAAYFTLARFGLAALLASPYTPGWRLWVDGLKENLDLIESTTIDNAVGMNGEEGAIVASNSQANALKERESIALAWRYGAELGIYMFLGYAFQAIGLETTTASRSGFFLYLNVKFVPFFSYFIFGKTIQRNTWISALVAFSGTALLAFDNANGATGGAANGLEMAFTAGDLWSIAAAALSALFILRMEAASKAVSKSSELNAANLWTVAVLSFLWTMGISWNNLIGSQGSGEVATSVVQSLPVTFAHATQQTFQNALSTITAHPIALIYLSGVTTALANLLQSKAQKDVSAERASVIYAMDPVYGAVFANILLGETLGGEAQKDVSAERASVIYAMDPVYGAVFASKIGFFAHSMTVAIYNFGATSY